MTTTERIIHLIIQADAERDKAFMADDREAECQAMGRAQGLTIALAEIMGVDEATATEHVMAVRLQGA